MWFVLSCSYYAIIIALSTGFALSTYTCNPQLNDHTFMLFMCLYTYICLKAITSHSLSGGCPESSWEM